MRYDVRLGLVLCVLLLASRTYGLDVNEIRVENIGAGTVDEESVLAYTSLRVGDEFNRNAISRDVKALQKSDRFAYVGAKAEPSATGVVVIYEVKNRYRFRSLIVKGADRIGSGWVRKKMDFKQGEAIDDTVVAVKLEPVRERYRKKHFPFAAFEWDIRPVGDSIEADVLLTVDEGQQARIKKVSFKGNYAISAGDLRKAMKQRRANLFSVFTKAGTFDPGQLTVDLEALRALYLNRGYLDALIGEPETRPVGKSGVEIIVPITEGFVYTVRKVDLEGFKLFPEAELRRAMAIRPGAAASLSEIDRSAQGIKDYYGSRGYIRTGVRRRVRAVPEEGVADLSFRITEGDLAYIRNIQIRGNTRTKDKVIRRELAVYPGDVFNEVRVRRSENRVRNLGFFSSVHSVPEETSDSKKYDLTLEVQEKKTGQFVVGAGFSSIDSLLGFVEISQGNFDIGNWPNFTGGGQKLKLRLQVGTERTDADISFTEPWFLDRRLSFNTTFFRSDRQFLSDDYDQLNTGGSVSLGKPISSFNRVRLRYTLQEIDVFNVSPTASPLIKAEEGARVQSTLGLELIHDSRNNAFIPNRGNRSTASGALSGGFLGGETDIYRLELRSSQYWPMWFDTVFNVRGRAAVVEAYGDSLAVPIFDRLFLGGARNLRGFEFRDVGPKDRNGEPIGGGTSGYVTLEYTVPIVGSFRVATFYDVGMVWLPSWDADFGNVNSDWGFGVRFDLPQFPLQLDYAWPLQADEFNDSSSGRFNFLLGYVY